MDLICFNQLGLVLVAFSKPCPVLIGLILFWFRIGLLWTFRICQSIQAYKQILQPFKHQQKGTSEVWLEPWTYSNHLLADIIIFGQFLLVLANFAWIRFASTNLVGSQMLSANLWQCWLTDFALILSFVPFNQNWFSKKWKRWAIHVTRQFSQSALFQYKISFDTFPDESCPF